MVAENYGEPLVEGSVEPEPLEEEGMLGLTAVLWPTGAAEAPEDFWAYRDPVQKMPLVNEY